MADDENVAPDEGMTPEEVTQQVEDKLGSFDFDKPEKPLAGGQQASEPVDGEVTETLAGETEPSKPAQNEDDREVILRDGRKVPISELKRGYRDDWERHIAAFQQRQQVFAKEAASFNQSQQEMAKLLGNAVAVVQNKIPRPPDPGLVDVDPFEYQRQKVRYDEGIGELQKLQYMQAQHHQRAVYQQRQEIAKRSYYEEQAAYRALPELKDPVKRAQLVKDIGEYANIVGYTPAEVNQLRDHRLLKILNDAIQGRRAMAAIEKAKEKAKAAASRPVEVQAPQRRRTTAQVHGDQFRAKVAALRSNPSSTKAAEDALSDPRFG